MCKTDKVLLETFAQNMPSNALFLVSKHPKQQPNKKKTTKKKL